jgi:hypothetical protein
MQTCGNGNKAEPAELIHLTTTFFSLMTDAETIGSSRLWQVEFK